MSHLSLISHIIFKSSPKTLQACKLLIDLKAQSSGVGYMQIYRSGVSTGQGATESGTNYVTSTIDLVFFAGETIEFWGHGTIDKNGLAVVVRYVYLVLRCFCATSPNRFSISIIITIRVSQA